MFKASTVASNCPLYENWGRRGVCAVTPMVLIEKQLLSTDTCVKSWACLTHIFTVLKTCPLTLFILIEWNQRQFCSLNFTLWWSSTFFLRWSRHSLLFLIIFIITFAPCFFVRNSHQVECVGLLTKHESIHPHVQYPWLLQTQSGYKMALWYFGAATVWEVILDTVVNRV